MTRLTDYQDAHARWVQTWERLPATDRGHMAAVMVEEFIAGWELDDIADEHRLGRHAVAAVVCAGLNAERARLAARVPRGREPPVGTIPTSTTSTTANDDSEGTRT
jgi:hypothetical protein